MPLNEKFDRTARVVRVAARLADFVLRKDTVIDRVTRIFGDRLVDKALESIEDAIDRKLSPPYTSRRATPSSAPPSKSESHASNGKTSC